MPNFRPLYLHYMEQYTVQLKPNHETGMFQNSWHSSTFMLKWICLIWAFYIRFISYRNIMCCHWVNFCVSVGNKCLSCTAVLNLEHKMDHYFPTVLGLHLQITVKVILIFPSLQWYYFTNDWSEWRRAQHRTQSTPLKPFVPEWNTRGAPKVTRF